MDANRCVVANSLVACRTIVLLSYMVNEAKAVNIRANRIREIYHRGPRDRLPRRTGKFRLVGPAGAIGPGRPSRHPRSVRPIHCVPNGWPIGFAPGTWSAYCPLQANGLA